MMAKRTAPIEDQIVRLLAKTSKVMEVMSMRIDVLRFGEAQLMRRVARLERQAAKSKGRKKA